MFGSLLECVWWAYEKDFPSVNVIIVDKSSRKTFHRVFIQLCQEKETEVMLK